MENYQTKREKKDREEADMRRIVAEWNEEALAVALRLMDPMIFRMHSSVHICW